MITLRRPGAGAWAGPRMPDGPGSDDHREPRPTGVRRSPERCGGTGPRGGRGLVGAQGHSLGLRLFHLAPPWCQHLDGDPAYRAGPGRRSPCAPILRGCRQVPIVAGWLATGRRLVQLGPCLGLRGRGGPGSPHFGGLGPPPGRAAGACWVGPARSPTVRGRHVYAVANRGTGVREHGPPRGRGASRERFPPPRRQGPITQLHGSGVVVLAGGEEGKLSWCGPGAGTRVGRLPRC